MVSTSQPSVSPFWKSCRWHGRHSSSSWTQPSMGVGASWMPWAEIRSDQSAIDWSRCPGVTFSIARSISFSAAMYIWSSARLRYYSLFEKAKSLEAAGLADGSSSMSVNRLRCNMETRSPGRVKVKSFQSSMIERHLIGDAKQCSNFRCSSMC